MKRVFSIDNGPRPSTALAVMVCLCTANLAPLFADEAEAKLLFESGMQKLNENRIAEAAEDFKRSFDEYPSSSSLYNLSICDAMLGRDGDAWVRFKTLRSSFADRLGPEQLKAVNDRMAELKERLPTLRVVSIPEGADVVVDGEDAGKTPIDAPMTMPPGAHRLEVSLQGFETVRRTVEILPSHHRQEIVVLKKAPGPTVEMKGDVRVDRTRRLRGNAVLIAGLSGTAIMTGISVGLWAAAITRWNDYHEKNDLLNLNWDDDLAAEQPEDRRRAEGYNTAAVVTTAVAGAFVVLTVTELFRQRGQRKKALRDITLGPAGVALVF